MTLAIGLILSVIAGILWWIALEIVPTARVIRTLAATEAQRAFWQQRRGRDHQHSDIVTKLATGDPVKSKATITIESRTLQLALRNAIMNDLKNVTHEPETMRILRSMATALGNAESWTDSYRRS